MRWSAGYSDPWFTQKTLRDICWMRWATPHPCIGSSERVLRISSSRVPWSRSERSDATRPSPVGGLQQQYAAAVVDRQEESRGAARAAGDGTGPSARLERLRHGAREQLRRLRPAHAEPPVEHVEGNAADPEATRLELALYHLGLPLVALEVRARLFGVEP